MNSNPQLLKLISDPNEPEVNVTVDHRFRVLADYSPILLWVAREDSLCTFFNSTWLGFTGRSMEEEWGVGWAEGIHAEDFQKSMDTYIQAFNHRQNFEMTYRLRRHDGEYRYLLDRGVPIFEKGVFTGFVGSCIDITEMRLAQEKLEANQVKLEMALAEVTRSNVELENFAYLASHDLQAPLRAIASFSALIAEKLDLTQDPELAEYFKILVSSAREMKGLMTALLNYSRVGRVENDPIEPVELNSLVDEIIQGDFVSLPDLKIQVESLPTVLGRRILLKQLFINLLSNAYKFRKPNQSAEVIISGVKVGLVWRISIRDSGIGIEEEYLDKVFGIFKRCHSHAEISGMGLGLAICKKVIEIHRGKIWVESVPNQGSVFHFTLPPVIP